MGFILKIKVHLAKMLLPQSKRSRLLQIASIFFVFQLYMFEALLLRPVLTKERCFIMTTDDKLTLPKGSSTQDISLRDYFAGKAIQALLSTDGTAAENFSFRSKEAYQIADAMLKARRNSQA